MNKNRSNFSIFFKNQPIRVFYILLTPPGQINAPPHHFQKTVVLSMCCSHKLWNCHIPCSTWLIPFSKHYSKLKYSKLEYSDFDHFECTFQVGIFHIPTSCELNMEYSIFELNANYLHWTWNIPTRNILNVEYGRTWKTWTWKTFQRALRRTVLYSTGRALKG